MTPAMRWTIIVIGLLLGNLVAMGVLVASSTANGAQVIPAYYERATKFDEELDDATRSHALGWRVAASMKRESLVVDVRDSGGNPIAATRVQIRGFHRAHAAARFDIELHALAPGRFGIDRANDSGVHDLEIVIERGDTRFVAHRVVEVR